MNPVRWIAVALMLLLAACGSSSDPADAPVATFDNPVLLADGTMTGIQGVQSVAWEQVDPDLRRGIYWYSFVNRLTVRCQVSFPEHRSWLLEVNALHRRASGAAVRAGIDMERQRLAAQVEGAESAVTGLTAMSQAEVDVASIVQGWVRSGTGEEISSDQAWIQGCSMLFDKDMLRGFLRNATRPLADYFGRMQTENPQIFATVDRGDVILRRLRKI